MLDKVIALKCFLRQEYKGKCSNENQHGKANFVFKCSVEVAMSSEVPIIMFLEDTRHFQGLYH